MTVRAALLVLALLALLGGAYVLIPMAVPEEVDLQLVVRGDDGAYSDRVRAGVDPVRIADAGDGDIRVPLVLALRNTGEVPGAPERIRLHVPPHVELVASESANLLRGRSVSEPLIRYVLAGPFEQVAPGEDPSPVLSSDTIWLRPTLRRWECAVITDSVPELVPARERDPEDLAGFPVYYSLEGGILSGSRSGTLQVRLDPAILDQTTPDTPPDFPVELRASGFQVHDSIPLNSAGAHDVWCGPLERPIELHVEAWQTPPGGLVLRLSYGGTPRKYLLDVDGDDVVERELWDPDGDGRYEASREARFPLPRFLIPPAAEEADPMPADTVSADTASPGATGEPAEEAEADPPQAPVDTPPVDTTPVVPEPEDTAVPDPDPEPEDTIVPEPEPEDTILPDPEPEDTILPEPEPEPEDTILPDPEPEDTIPPDPNPQDTIAAGPETEDTAAGERAPAIGNDLALDSAGNGTAPPAGSGAVPTDDISREDDDERRAAGTRGGTPPRGARQGIAGAGEVR